MAGHIIHLAVAKVYEQFHEIKDKESFERGAIAPDLAQDKTKSHYGEFHRNPDFNTCLKERGMKTEFDEGYLLHLITDFLFYKVFLDDIKDPFPDELRRALYDDYDILNGDIIEIYNIEVPEDVKGVVKRKQGKLTFLNKKAILKFINAVGRINIREMIGKNPTDIQSQISNIELER